MRNAALTPVRFELRVEYVAEVYELSGEWREGRLRGTWRHTNGVEQSTWAAEREPAPPRPDGETVALYEWQRVDDGARYYDIDGASPGSGWQRNPRALGRVWRKTPVR